MSTQQASPSTDAGQRARIFEDSGQRAQETLGECEMQLKDLQSKLRNARSELCMGEKKFSILENMVANGKRIIKRQEEEIKDLKKANEELKQAYNQLLSDLRRIQGQPR
ncbi:hypothetical protein F52700_2457 [Fusarium sp. NRRL 52700]|nr:hypothetical protein F52700_2457 [Fusarium sp. NRRL 52700]